MASCTRTTWFGIRIVSLLFALGSALSASAQLNLSDHGTNYMEDFNGIAGGLPSGWTVNLSATASSLGVPTTFNITNIYWSKNTGQFANYASTISDTGTNFLGSESTGIQSACTNRALAVRKKDASGFDPGAAFVLQILNTTNRFNFLLNMDCVMLATNARVAAWTVDYAVGSSPSSFIPLGTVEDSPVFGKTNVSYSFGSALDDQSGPVWIRIAALSGTTGNGYRNTFGIDNFSLSWSDAASPAMSPIPLNIELIGGAAVLTWTNSAFQLQSTSGTGGGYSTIPGATSPYTNVILDAQTFFRLVRTNY